MRSANPDCIPARDPRLILHPDSPSGAGPAARKWGPHPRLWGGLKGGGVQAGVTAASPEALPLGTLGVWGAHAIPPQTHTQTRVRVAIAAAAAATGQGGRKGELP